jgi:hypothetical protein
LKDYAMEWGSYHRALSLLRRTPVGMRRRARAVVRS